MPDFPERLKNILLAEDEAANAVVGGAATETISGSVGRACQAGRWWAPAARVLIEAQPWFGKGHCARVAAEEAARRKAWAELS